MRPEGVDCYIPREFCGGTVWYQRQYPRVLFAKDGEVFHFDVYDCIVIGGAYSVDKYYRLARGWNWFENVRLSEKIKEYVEKQLACRSYKIDIVLSHTCPKRYEPIEVFISGLDQSTIDKTTEEWLGKIEENLDYKRWYCGHYHTSKRIDKMQFMFEDVDTLKG